MAGQIVDSWPPQPGQPGGGFEPDSGKALDMLQRYNQFMQQQTANGGAPPGGVADSVGGQPAMTAGGVAGPTPAPPAGGPAHTAVPGMAPTGGAPGVGPAPGGGFPTVNGQGVIPANGVIGGPAVDNPRITGGVGVTPSAGLNNGNSLPPAGPGGTNMRIQNGSQIQDVQYTPAAGGPGVTATTMRDVGTGVTFVMGPNGQFYPAGSTQQPAAPGQGVTPGQSFANAQANLGQLGFEQAQANLLGLTPDAPTLAALRQIRLMGAGPSSPVGQAVIARTLGDYNQHQTELEKTRIAVGPATIAAQTQRDQFNNDTKLRDMELKVDSDVSKEFPGIDAATHNRILNQRMEPYRRAWQSPAAPGGQGPPPAPGVTPPAAPAAVAAADAGSRENLGPDIFNALTALKPDGKGGAVPAVPIKDLMVKIFQFDQQHPGYMRNNGRQIMAMVQNAYGAHALQDTASLGFNDGMLGRGLGALTGGRPVVEDQAMSAWRDALGLPGYRRLYGGIGNMAGGGASDFLNRAR